MKVKEEELKKTSANAPEPEAETEAAAPLLGDLPNGKKYLLLAVMYVAAFSTMVFSGSDSILLPKAGEALGALDYYSVALPLSSIVTIVMMPLTGFLMARNPGIKIRLFAILWAVAVAGAIIMAAAMNYGMIIIGMMLARMCFPAVYVAGFSIIRELFDAKQAGLYIGLSNTVMLGSNVIVPTISGVIIDVCGWRMMYIVLAVCCALPALTAFFSRVSYPARAKALAVNMPFDFIGLFALVLTMGGFIPFVALGRSLVPFGTPLSWGFLALFAVGIVVLAYAVRKKGEACVLPLPALKDKNVLCLFLGNFTNNFAILSVYFFLPTYMMLVMGCSATEAGLATSLHSIPGVFLAAFVGRWIGKHQSIKMPNWVGFIFRFLVIGFFAFFLTPETPSWVPIAVFFVGGFYTAMAGSLYTAGPQILIPSAKRASGVGIVTMGQNLGSATATCVYGLMMSAFGIANGLHYAFMLALVIVVINWLVLLPVKKED